MFKNRMTAPLLLSVFVTAILFFAHITGWWISALTSLAILALWFIFNEMLHAEVDPEPISQLDYWNRGGDAPHLHDDMKGL